MTSRTLTDTERDKPEQNDITRLPYPVLAFDVDIPGGRIYAIDEKEDRLRVYDAKKISRLYGQKQSR